MTLLERGWIRPFSTGRRLPAMVNAMIVLNPARTLHLFILKYKYLCLLPIYLYDFSDHRS
jgi:hypothetical protein